ncbi:hypothetical protein [Chryseobacterium sp.]|uniref:beta-barrel fold lipoprotein n=1 Tax=Chryseobacterium sp. TaxID=1871047 RepID=UPI0025BFFED7|nr:hypothetical protein [Chryseobacterium sp.]
MYVSKFFKIISLIFIFPLLFQGCVNVNFDEDDPSSFEEISKQQYIVEIDFSGDVDYFNKRLSFYTSQAKDSEGNIVKDNVVENKDLQGLKYRYTVFTGAGEVKPPILICALSVTKKELDVSGKQMLITVNVTRKRGEEIKKLEEKLYVVNDSSFLEEFDGEYYEMENINFFYSDNSED